MTSQTAERDPGAPVDGEPDGTALIDLDPWLEPYADALRRRYLRYREKLEAICRSVGSLAGISRGHEYFGFNRGEHEGQPGVWYREWAPGAEALFAVGDFNGWDRGADPMTRDEYGVWSVFLADEIYGDRLVHGGHVAVHVVGADGGRDHVPAYIRRAVREHDVHPLCGQYWRPPEPYQWRQPGPSLQGSLRVYEAHVGMALEAERVGTYVEFAEQMLPRIVKGGYNAIQLMAVMEHPYYASFGYQVSNFFAASSRFGTPEELKGLIDAAHGQGLVVLLDVVHSHAVKNVADGLNRLDGTDHQYFHAGRRGWHSAWDSRLFDYGKWEVLRFLLSNVRFWLEEYRFDGFRFDGITSMMYRHHGLGRTFTCYDDYLIHDLDEDGIVYLQLANQLVHEINPRAVTIAEDVSGMVGLARPLVEGGLGFDYRLAMGLPDYWIRTLAEQKDEEWHLGGMYRTLTNRRRDEKHIAYVESHDQALVGDKTIAFRLMDAEMYWHMGRESERPVIDRGMALHKMLRLITFTLGGEGYLNFIGNEFGHPEWIDFPREGNGFSYKHARRQWSLLEDPGLRYGELGAFDRAMQDLDDRFQVLANPFYELLQVHEDCKLLVYRRGPLIFVFNFHPAESYADYGVGLPDPLDYEIILDTDAAAFGGHARVADGQVYPCQSGGIHGREHGIQVYIPCRSAQVLAPR
ncbi:MAG TPA: alpha amylase C-terminal domain-containing protein [Phycisphaerae bacterium]|nr:alpha amylase C-terminal domain-containing protein [Phycisphaerae bacterium]